MEMVTIFDKNKERKNVRFMCKGRQPGTAFQFVAEKVDVKCLFPPVLQRFGDLNTHR